MKLIPKYKDYIMDEYFCELTTDLDELAGIDKKCRWKHYIMIDVFRDRNICAIRIPGGTVGDIYYDDNNIITDIKIDTKYVVKTYPDNIEEIIKKKYVGTKIEM